jgi:small-conductance mechanosensitive channel
MAVSAVVVSFVASLRADLISREELWGSLAGFVLLALLPALLWTFGYAMQFAFWAVSHRSQGTVDDIAFDLLAWLLATLPVIALAGQTVKMVRRFPLDVRQSIRELSRLASPSNADAFRSPPWTNYFIELNGVEISAAKAAVCIGITALAIAMLRSVCNRSLRAITKKTTQKMDDLVVELLRIFGTLVIGAMGLGWTALSIFGTTTEPKDILDGAGALTPYAIVVAIGTAVLGVGTRDLLENFFAGITLQVDRPFETGERVGLQDGSIYEVRAIGMRTTQLYHLPENADVFIPNAALAAQTISNLSRPDRQQRRTLTIYVADSARLTEVEGYILAAAYLTDGIDRPIVASLATASAFRRSRSGILEEFVRLQSIFDELSSARIRLHGKDQLLGEFLVGKLRSLNDKLNILSNSERLLWSSDTGLPRPLSEIKDDQTPNLTSTVALAREVFGMTTDIGAALWTVTATFPSLRVPLDSMLHELLRAPSISSTQVLSSMGTLHWQVDLGFYAQLVETSDDVHNSLNLVINELVYGES